MQYNTDYEIIDTTMWKRKGQGKALKGPPTWKYSNNIYHINVSLLENLPIKNQVYKRII